MKIAILHPGEMGAAVGAALVASGAEVVWVPAGRSPATAERARRAGLRAVEDVAEADVILSICPPGAALDVARGLAGFGGLYIDANAISPATSAEVAALMPRFVDGGIIGGPPREPGGTRLYLSGAPAQEAAALFAGSVLDARVVSDASALKLAYAAWTKGSAALLLAIREMAAAYGVTEPLLEEWALSQPDVERRLDDAAASAASKGWRWVGEMEEIAAAFAAAGQPEGFHEAAAAIYPPLRALG